MDVPTIVFDSRLFDAIGRYHGSTVVLDVCKIDFSSKVQQRNCKIQVVVAALNVLDHTGHNL